MPVFRCLLVALLGVGAALVPPAFAAAAPTGQLILEDFRLEPLTLPVGSSFRVRARVVEKGARLGSFLLRTAEATRQADAPPGFAVAAGSFCYLAEGQDIHLRDNGARDADKETGAFALEVNTRGWKEGRYPLAFFASNRPAPGTFVAARRDFAVIVSGGTVTIDAPGRGTSVRNPAIAELRIEPAVVNAGEFVRIAGRFAPQEVVRARLIDAYYVAPAKVLPGFAYDAEKKKSSLELTVREGVTAAEVDTRGWPAGAHHLVLQVMGPTGKTVAERPFAIKVIGPGDRLAVVVEPSVLLGPGTHFGRFVKLRDGTLLCEDRRSRDGGRTWESGTGGFGVGAEELRDGTVIGLAYRCLPIAEKAGSYAVERSMAFGGAAFAKDEVTVVVPEAKGAMGHALHVGPLFMRSILERRDGSLVAFMAGWFKSDTALCPYGRGRPYSRSYLCESDDGGRTWRYLTTIGYEEIGSEGYNEGSMRRLPDGSWLAVLRTGNATDPKCQDNPIMWAVSRDEGRTWTRPQRTGLEGCYPSLAVLRDGLVAMSYGRPGAKIAFSADGGQTWGDVTCVDATVSSGYTDVVELEPGLLLVGFGTRGFEDPQTGERSDGLRLARVRYLRR